MATKDVTRPQRDRYYDAPTVIKEVPGVTRKVRDDWSDEYRGTAEALAAAGLLPLDRFPGAPGQNQVAAALRPRGALKAKGDYWHWTPGYMRVVRQVDGTFVIRLMVSAAETDRRCRATEARENAANAAAEAVLSQLPGGQRKYLQEIIESHGRTGAEHWFRRPEFLARQGISPNTAALVLRGLEVFDQAEIERELARSPMRDALAVIARVAH